MKLSLRLLTLTLVLSAFGCQGNSGSTVAEKKAEPSTTGSAAPSTTTGGAAPTPAAPTLDQLPKELQHTAYEFYGLANDKPMDMEIRDSQQKDTVLTGSQTIKLKSIEDGKAVFDIERTGSLAQLGAQEVTLEKDGVYVTASDVAKVNHDLELPTDLSDGKTWNNKMIVDQPGSEVQLDNTFKIEGTRNIKTKVGDRTALLITSTGKGKMQGNNVTMTSENYYVKGVGGVKSVIKITYPDKKVRTMTIEETKP